MRITSPAFSNFQPVPVKYTCQGPNTSPPLEFLDVPSDTKSFVLIVKDTDAPNQWIHWLVYNIPATTTCLDEGKLPQGAIDGVCNGGTHGYEGPCPKYFSGIHRYAFTLYALNTVLDVPLRADSSVVMNYLKEDSVLATAELIGLAQGDLKDTTTPAQSQLQEERH